MLDMLQKEKTVIRREHKLDQITELFLSIIKWHPSGKLLVLLTRKKVDLYMTYNLETKEFKQIEMLLSKKLFVRLFHDGLSCYCRLIMVNQISLFLIFCNTLVIITQDNADDYQPHL